MRIGRTIPPAASPNSFLDLLSGLKGLWRGESEVRSFCDQLRFHYQVEHCFLLSSGKAALTQILRALHQIHPERSEVVIPAFTCYSVPAAVLKAGLKVKLCDLDEQTLDYDYSKLNKILSNQDDGNGVSSILAVISTHLFGLAANTEKTKQLISEDQIFIIEDAAQAMGGVIQDRQLGTLGDVGFFSLGRGKSFSTIEGGVILTGNDEIAHHISRQMNDIPHYNWLEICSLIVYSFILMVFTRPELFWFPRLMPFLKLGETRFETDFPIKRLSAFQAGIANKWRHKMENLIQKRANNIQYWKNFFFKKVHKDGVIFVSMNSSHALIRFPLKIESQQKRTKLLSRSEQEGLGIMPVYPDSINGIEALKDEFKGQSFNVAKKLAQTLVTIPVHPFVTDSDNDRIAQNVSESL